MVSERLRLPLVLAIACVAAYLTYHYISKVRQTVTVITARTDIKAGTLITADMLASVSVGEQEQQVLAPGAIRDQAQVLGRAPKRDLKQGSVLTLDPDSFWLAPDTLSQVSGGSAAPAYLIPAGKVAIGVPADAEGSVAYLLQKGDRVDVIWTGSADNKTTVSKTIISPAEVFDIDQDKQGGFAIGGHSPVHTITLLVTPADAERLALAKRSGRIDLSLVSR